MSTKVAAVLLGRSVIAAKHAQELERLAEQLSSCSGIDLATFAFMEQSDPSFRAVAHRLRDESYSEVVLIPLMLPMDSDVVSFLSRTLHRWQIASPGGWPIFRIGQRGPADTSVMPKMLVELFELAAVALPLEPEPAPSSAGSIVPAQKRRVLLCMAGPCYSAGASDAWDHLRNEAKRLSLRNTGEGTLVVKTSCLGPCGLAPVLQVTPEGVYYGGVDEAGIDRIIQEHLLNGRIVHDLAYECSEARQQLRPKKQSFGVHTGA